MKTKANAHMPLTNEEMVFQYFRLIENKDLDSTLDLFQHDAIIYEPFSKVEGLQGRSSIEPFLKVAMMANTDLRRLIEIERRSVKPNKLTALVTFEKGDRVKARFTFEFIDDISTGRKKIKSLHIEF